MKLRRRFALTQSANPYDGQNENRARGDGMTKLIAGLQGKCSVPLFGIGGPAGFCDRPAYGQQYRCEFLPPRYQKPNRPPYAPYYCCEIHGGAGEADVRMMRDGSAWMAFDPDFENLQESIAGFGATQGEALADLIRNKAKAGAE